MTRTNTNPNNSINNSLNTIIILKLCSSMSGA